MRLLYRIGLVTQALLYVAAGMNHFWHTAMYVAIMPPHYAHPVGLVQISGVAEVLGGIGLLVPWSRRFAAWGIVAMLVVYFDVHIYMAMHADRFATIPVWLIYARLPLQLLLIAWAGVYAVRPSERQLP
ncbi:DoxX family protein [Terriglobus roseus]|uniref:Uncharacterized membrane protein n=1 Tax=Terriglobus roseus TaxID=392734 RepID=A0A1G7MN59_9BACT|nr:DoxX family protein [Terriglobus roseus]SDF63212.1 Uncharacterized membrane protein [Terriglobus roseus]